MYVCMYIEEEDGDLKVILQAPLTNVSFAQKSEDRRDLCGR